ncbi:MAG: VCBS repeat-containing protein, partial [Bacteroidota bacterium]
MGCFLCLVLGCLSGCGERENHPSSTRFTALSAAHTGVDFRNYIRETDSLNVLGFEYIFNGGGVGLADLNGDTLPDLILAGNQTPTELYLNRGDLQFEKITASAGLQPAATYWTTGVAVGDLNGDGLQDIHLASISPRRGGGAPNQLFLHQGTDADGRPHFREVALTAGLADTAYVTQVAFLDYDRD